MDWSDVRVTITGGAGFLGTVVCERLAGRGVGAIRDGPAPRAGVRPSGAGAGALGLHENQAVREP